ncbi:MAG: hypothetical protein DRH12_14500 [Deltaproteobacteria bacterium]|nr:MAG: hypothetical protein DRH12_14500 [Deltaproteobacteria bacterium]
MSSKEADIVFNVDSLKLIRRRLHGWGWIYSKELKISNVEGVATKGKKKVRFNCVWGIPRNDVRQTFLSINFPGGFLISQVLPFVPDKVYIDVRDKSGRQELIDITPFLEFVPLRHSFYQLLKRWLKLTFLYLLRGDFTTWLKLASTKLHQVLPQLKPKKKFEKEYVNLSITNAYLIVDHDLGGGANYYRKRLIEEALAENKEVILLTYNFAKLSYSLNTYNNGKEDEWNLNIADFYTYFRESTPEKIVVNNLVSFEDPLLLLNFLIEIKRQGRTKIVFPLHDYFCICPSFYLINSEGSFCEVPQSWEICYRCLNEHKGRFTLFFPSGPPDIRQWRKTWGWFLQEVDEVRCFSQASADILKKAYPELTSSKIVIQSHSLDDFPVQRPKLDFSRGLHIGVVGHILEEKGAGILREMAEIIHEKTLPVRITVIGDMEIPPSHNFFKITGPYSRIELPKIIEKSGANIFFVPSIWPETFCLTAEELMALRVPLAVFDIGAPPERVAKYSYGLVIKEINAFSALKELMNFFEQMRNQWPVENT